MCCCCCCGDRCMRWNNMIWYDGCVYISLCHALCIVSCHFMSWYFRTCERCSAILNPTLSFHPRLSHHKHIHYRNQSNVLLSSWKVENKLSLWGVQCTSLLLVCGTVWTDSCIKCFLMPVTAIFSEPDPLTSYDGILSWKRREEGGDMKI